VIPGGFLNSFLNSFLNDFLGDIKAFRSPSGAIRPDGSLFTIWIHQALVLASSLLGATAKGSQP
jgi:hypothetical protein